MKHARTKRWVKRSLNPLSTYFYLVVFFCFIVNGHAEVLDRIMAVVEGHIITLSDVRQERQVRAELGEKQIEEDRALVKQLVDNYLIKQQISDYPNIEVTESEIDAEFAQLKIDATAVSKTLRDAVRQRIRVQKFFDVKFRQVIRPTETEVRKYYEDVFLPEARARGLQSIPPLTDPEMTKAVRENVIQESLDHEVEVWLEAMRRRSNFEVFE